MKCGNSTAGIGILPYRYWLMQFWRSCGYGRKKTPTGLIALSVAELRKLLSKLMEKAGETVEQVLHWSSWRRRHQYYAQQCHYRRRDNLIITEHLRL
ncbi:transposase [Xenorhabdus cabanillasii JM26]|nr:transposase [Xenorhabdus cabanillasii JM26]